MTITIYIAWFLPAYKAGGPVQTIANLVARPPGDLQYRIVTSHRDLDGTVLSVAPDQWVDFNPWTRVYYASKGTSAVLPGAREHIVFLNGMYSWQFTLKPVLFSAAQRKIVSPRGMLHAGALSQKAWKKKLYLQLWKWAGLHRKVAFHATDSTEAAAIRRVFGNAVTIHQAANLPKILECLPLPPKEKGKLHLLSIALLSPMKNILPVLRALKEVEQEVDYHLYGPVKDRTYWRQCEAVIATLPANIRVTWHGDIHPAAVEETLGTGHVFILPSRSENFGHALYEALSAGRPVITSCATPWNGLEKAGAGKNIDPEKSGDIAAAIRFFAAMDLDELESWSRAAHRYAKAALDPALIEQQYRRMFMPGINP